VFWFIINALMEFMIMTEMQKNNVRQFREELLISKAELARKAGLSALTIDRIEKGMSCRMDTKRKILLALGLKLTDKDRLFP
jgi:DNA-binding XRE family transcriptional regulator